MYQLLPNDKTDLLRISSILITCNKYHQKSAFIFFNCDLEWYQVYFDENVIFIVGIGKDIQEYLNDFDEIKQIEISFYKIQEIFLQYLQNKIVFIGTKFQINFIIKDGDFYFSHRLSD